VRRSLGQVQHWSRRVDLAAMTPRAGLASSKYCLANPGREYLVYLPDGKETTLDLTGATSSFSAAWFNPDTGETRKAASVQGGGTARLVSPFASKHAVLHLQRTEP